MRAMSDKIQSYQEFWPYYLREHSQPATRAWHYFGTSLSLLVLIAAIISQNGWFVLGAVISGYFFAWVSHGAIEKNKPATFTYPLWSLASDFRMLFCFVTGRMGAELEKAGLPKR
jgi:hypothetical protein